MTLPFLQLCPISTSHYYVSGDVTIHAGVAIAPGVLLQADPDSRVIVRAGVCIGMGAVLHAHAGVIEVGEGANIGAEVLLLGQVTIGARACVGAATTILNTAIGVGQLVPPGSLIGETLIGETSPVGKKLQVTETVTLPPDQPHAAIVPDPTAPEPSANSVNGYGQNVYGQMYVNRLLVKMFPGSQRFANPNGDTPRSSPEDPWDD